jgi:pyrimidine operon attenuation protein/uracil phosphoribosyltransferase
LSQTTPDPPEAVAQAFVPVFFFPKGKRWGLIRNKGKNSRATTALSNLNLRRTGVSYNRSSADDTMSLTREKSQLMSASEIDRTLVRLAHEILEKSADLDKLAFIGIRRRGVPLAQRLARKIESLEKREIPVGILDINLYRDDLTTVDIKPVVSATDIPFSVQGKDIILMDDVLYTGRTIRAALDALFDHGRPSRVQLLVLIDRGHRELPIEARFIGRTVQTSDDEIIEVKFQEVDEMEKVLMVERVASGTGA